jgi:hypothetical protein
MVEKQTAAPVANDKSKDKQEQRKTEDKTTVSPPEPVAVDRPGFDLGGSTGKTRAGTGLGLGRDAFENRSSRSLPRGRWKNK